MSKRIDVGSLVWVTQFDIPEFESEEEPDPSEEIKPPKVKSRRLAYVTGGSYYGSNGSVSNHWYWTYFNEAKSLTKETGCGYNNGMPFLLEESKDYQLVITAIWRKP